MLRSDLRNHIEAVYDEYGHILLGENAECVLGHIEGPPTQQTA